MKNRILIRSISLKIYLSTALLTLVAIIVLSKTIFHQYSKSLREHSSEKAQQVLELSAMNIESYLEDLYRLSLSPYYNQEVMDALDKNNASSDLVNLNRTRTIEEFLEQILINPRQDILRVFLFTDRIYKGEHFPSSIDSDQDFHYFNWYQEALKTEEPLLVSAHLEQLIKNPKNVVFSIVRILKSTSKINRILGVIKVDANFSSIIHICDKINFGTEGGVYIVDSKNQLIYSNVPNFDPKSVTPSLVSTSDINGRDYLINSTPITNSNWTMVGVTAYSTINKRINTVRRTAILLAFLCFLVSLGIIYLYLYKFLSPLYGIIRSIKMIQNGNLDFRFHVTSGDELGVLAMALNEMVFSLDMMFKENNKLNRQVYEAKYLQKEAQIQSLFHQIQPHFIYNTLNMISMEIQTDNIEGAVQNINQLSIMLRGLSHLDKDIPILTEIEFLSAYLLLQKNRYIDRLDYSIHINPSLQSYMLPALSLQPIVENSVIHGCESKKSLTHIKIYDVTDEDNIILVVEDDGVGMKEAQLVKLREKLSRTHTSEDVINPKDKSSGIALVNVNRRLQIKYGEEYGIQVESLEHQGTKVKIYLPKKP